MRDCSAASLGTGGPAGGPRRSDHWRPLLWVLDLFGLRSPAASALRFRLLLFGSGVAAAGLLFPIPAALDVPLVNYAQDFVHAPLFAIVFLGLRRLGERGRSRSELNRIELAAAILAVAMGAATEKLQDLAGRDSSWADLGYDSLGIAVAWLGAACWRRARIWRLAHAALVLGLGLGAAGVIARKAALIRQFDLMLPVLAGFEHAWELDRWHAKRGTQITRIQNSLAEGGWALEVDCSADARYPGVSIEEFAPDWRRYRWLSYSVGNPSKEPLRLLVRIDDDRGGFGTRYTAEQLVPAGTATYRIDFRDVVKEFAQHPMNMANITEVHFFLEAPVSDQRFTLDALRLIQDESQ